MQVVLHSSLDLPVAKLDPLHFPVCFEAETASTKIPEKHARHPENSDHPSLRFQWMVVFQIWPNDAVGSIAGRNASRKSQQICAKGMLASSRKAAKRKQLERKAGHQQDSQILTNQTKGAESKSIEANKQILINPVYHLHRDWHHSHV